MLLQPHASSDEKIVLVVKMTRAEYYGAVGMVAPDGKNDFWLGAQKESAAADQKESAEARSLAATAAQQARKPCSRAPWVESRGWTTSRSRP